MQFYRTNQSGSLHIRLLIHGDSGVGKTTLATTLNPEKTLIILTEPKAMPLIDHNFPCLRPESFDELDNLVRQLQGLPVKDRVEGLEPDKYKNVFLDSLTSAGDMLMQKITSVDRSALMLARSKGARSTPDNIYEDLMTQEDYGLFKSKMKYFIINLNSIPFHTICTALSLWKDDRETGEKTRIPDLPGSTAVKIGSQFDFVFHMCMKKKHDNGQIVTGRVLQTDASPGIAAKGSPKLAQYVLPNLSDVFRDLLTPADANKTNKTAKTAGNEASA